MYIYIYVYGIYIYIYVYVYDFLYFDSISTIVGYLMPKPFFKKTVVVLFNQ